MKKYHDVRNISFSEKILEIEIDGVQKKFSLSKVSCKLLQASDREREHFEVTPSGCGIHWPTLDEDLSIDGLLGIVHYPQKLRKTA